MTPESLRRLKAAPPDVFIIDLSRMPSQGRDVGVMLRRTASTRRVPRVFVGGDREKVAGIRKLLGDAVYTKWPKVAVAIERARRRGDAGTVVQDSAFAAYAGTPLVRKLGITEGSTVALIGAPDRFEEKLSGLPEGVRFRRDLRGRCDLALWFVRSSSELRRRIARVGSAIGEGAVWVAWPKRASGVESDLTQAIVREAGLASGLVDYKVCSIDDVWSGLKFTVRRGDGKKRGT
jgi:hypothetical protein